MTWHEERARVLALPRPDDGDAIRGFFDEYRWLSNFHEAPLMLDGIIYPSAENAYQAMKYPPEQREMFSTLTPAQAKSMGRRSKHLPVGWDDHKHIFMERVVLAKFVCDRTLLDRLLATKELHLEETNWWMDQYWGVCGGVGENMLGRILMGVRNTVEWM